MKNDYNEKLAVKAMERYQKGCNFIVTVGYKNHYFMCADEALEYALSAYFSSDEEVTLQVIEALNNVKFENSTQVDTESENEE